MNSSMFLAILLMAAVTFLTRGLPFAACRPGQPIPKTIAYLGQVLPLAMMAMLVVYGLRSTDWLGSNHGLPELLALAVTGVIHGWKRNSPLSIGCGTLFYMVLVQQIFR